RERVVGGLDGFAPRELQIPMYSTIRGERLLGRELDADYWFRNLRLTVRFAETIEKMLTDGYRFFIEVSPATILRSALEDLSMAVDPPGVAVGSLSRGDGSPARLMRSLGELHTRGLRVDWSKVSSGRRVSLPTYPFQRQRYWLDVAKSHSVGGTIQVQAPAADTGFWNAVESGDLDSLAQALNVDGPEQRASLNTLLPALGAWRRSHQERTTLNSWRYSVTWKPMPASASIGDVSGAWLVVTGSELEDVELSLTVLQNLESAGAKVTHVTVDEDEPDREDFAARLRRATTDLGETPIRGVLSLLALIENPLVDQPALPAGLALNLALIQALGDVQIGAPLWMLTQGAVSVGGADVLGHPLQAMAWGLGRVVALEHSERWGGLIDIPADLDLKGARRLVSALGQSGEDQLALRNTGLFVRRISR
ncbi:MAG: acyltransferase domain-containing protein, partial [Myxococcales bacterium]|nr:acyltransferase domain-containing protein [Myxococcales bacterium]